MPSFQQRNSKEIRYPEMLECARILRSRYQGFGVIGFCYGGWGCFRLGAESPPVVDCISMAHPTHVEKDEIRNVRVPVQILAPQHDTQFNEDLKAFSNQTIPTLGLPYDYQYFPGLEHAFATRGDPKNPAERKGMERAKNAAVSWFRQWLENADSSVT